MKRFALAVVLSFSISHFAVAQHHSGGGSSSSSSSSSGGSSSAGGYSGGSSGGYSGGSSHSSGSSGGGGYSGGSSHSSGSSGGYSGGSHSAGGSGSSVGGSSHSGGGSHSNAGSGHSGGSSNAGNSHFGYGNSSARTNMRSGTNSVEHVGNFSGPSQTGGPIGSTADRLSTFRQATASGDAWMYKSFTLDISAKNLNKAVAHREFDGKLQGVGLESSKSAYREKVGAIGINFKEGHRPNWIARMFGAKTTAPKQSVSPQLRPCLNKECKPVPVPPKPCVGKKCPVPTPPPIPTPSTGVCTNGYDAYGYCAPWGYVDRCSTQSDYCYVRFARVNRNYCGRILQQIRREQASYLQVEQTQQSSCAAGPQSQECAQASQKLQQLGNDIFQLQHQYQLCQTATGWVTADPGRSIGTAAPSPNGWPHFRPPFF